MEHDIGCKIKAARIEKKLTQEQVPCDATGLGCSPFARHYWGNHSFIFSSGRY